MYAISVRFIQVPNPYTPKPARGNHRGNKKYLRTRGFHIRFCLEPGFRCIRSSSQPARKSFLCRVNNAYLLL